MSASALPVSREFNAPSSSEPVRQAGGAALEVLHGLSPVRSVVVEKLVPKILDVDQNAEYPQEFLQALGQIGGFRGAAATSHGGNGLGLKHVIQVMEEVSKECLSSGFLVWCQTACARYIQMSNNKELREKYLPQIISGTILAGTGLSNTLKSCDTIEDFRLTAKRVTGGYLINGVLPWVSNLGEGHYFATGCPVEGVEKSINNLVFVLVDCKQPGFKLVDCAHFVALDGTRTLACHFKDSFVPDAMVLSHSGQSANYVKRIKPGMILAQTGMALGLIEACVEMMRQSNRTHAHVNQYLDDQADDIHEELQHLRSTAYALAEKLAADPKADLTLNILKARLAGSELSLRAANAALLHQGAKGYLLRNPAQRRMREAYFIAIVTPAIKHLRHEINRIEKGMGCN